jgi:hypothetical protein
MIDIVSTAGPASEAPREPTRFVPVAGRDGQLPPIETTSASLSGIVFVIEGVTKFTAGAWVAIVLMGAITVTALRTRRYYVLTGQQLALRAEEAATPAALPAKFAPRPPSSRPSVHKWGGTLPRKDLQKAAEQLTANQAGSSRLASRPSKRAGQGAYQGR